MLTVRDIASAPGADLTVAAGEAGLANEVRWVHVSELEDPTPWLEGGELLLTTGIGVGGSAEAQRAYVARLAERGLAGLGLGVGFGFDAVPEPLAEEAERLGFPVLAVPYHVPFIAVTKLAFTQLASDELRRVKDAVEVHERLAQAVLDGRGVQALLAILCERLDCSLALVDESGRTIGERHAGRRLGFDGADELPVAGGSTLKAARATGRLSDYDRLILHHGRIALALELSRRRAVSAAELRLAGDLLEDLEHDRLDDRDVVRRMVAFGLDPDRSYCALLALPPAGDGSADRARVALAHELEARGRRHLSTARRGRAAFLAEADGEDDALELAHALAAVEPGSRIGVGRPASGSALGRSLLEARAALDAAVGAVASYRDLGALELLLGLPDAALEAYVARVLGPVARSGPLLQSLRALLDAGCRWSEAAAGLGIHRHTLRYRMDRLEEQTGRHPDRPAERMELWLAVKATQALGARAAERAGSA
jgi:PucR family transcriptional regulator, purine catabolism regulatory protein